MASLMPRWDPLRYLQAVFGSAVLAPCGPAMSELQNMASYLRFCK